MKHSFSDLPYFRKISYPLGSKATAGQWRVCATTNPWIERSKLRPESEIGDGSVTNCVEFEVIDEREPEPMLLTTPTVNGLTSSSSDETLVVDSGLTSEQHFVTLKFGEEMKKTFRFDVPITGRVRAAWFPVWPDLAKFWAIFGNFYATCLCCTYIARHLVTLLIYFKRPH